MQFTTSITPRSQEALQTFCQMASDSTIDQPIIEMNDETSRDIEIIWKSIAALALKWRGERDVIMPDYPTNRKEFWGKMAADHAHPPEDLISAFEFINQIDGKGRFAIDLGCGNSPATKQLVEKGWHVLAVDYSRHALEVLKAQCPKAVASGQLTLIEADITTFLPSEPADLVIAANVFPYIDPLKFPATWQKVHDTCVKENGILIGSLFRSTSDYQSINVMKEWGAWFLPDRRMVRPLLTHSGYEIQKCVFGPHLPGKEPMCIDFIVKKANVTKKHSSEAKT